MHSTSHSSQMWNCVCVITSIVYEPMNKIAEKRKGMVYFKSGGKVFQAWLEQTSGYPQHRWLQRWRLESKSNSVLYQPGQAWGMLSLSGSLSFFISALKMSIWCELVTVCAKHLASVRYTTNRGCHHKPYSTLGLCYFLFMFIKLIFIVERDCPKGIILMNCS